MTLARHCGSNVQWRGAQGEQHLFGTTNSGDPSMDAALLSGGEAVSGIPTYAPGVYVGVYNGSEYTTVDGLSWPSVGAQVCFSGALSGATCNSYITITSSYVDGVGPGFWAEQVDHQPAAGNGDSGGPVLAASMYNGLNAIGTITLGDPNGAADHCSGVPAGDGRTCYWRTFTVSLANVLAKENVRLKVVPH